MPIRVVESEGYLITVFEEGESINAHFLAADYDTDIDHRLDETRFHRSRVNYINEGAPISVSRTIRIASEKAPQVFTPFHEEVSQVESKDGILTITLPEKCACAVLRF